MSNKSWGWALLDGALVATLALVIYLMLCVFLLMGCTSPTAPSREKVQPVPAQRGV